MTTDTSYATVRRATEDDRTAVVDILTESFATDPVAGWLFPDPGERRRLQPPYFGLLLTHPEAEVYLAGREGAAVWLPGNASQQQPDVGTAGERFLALGAALAGRHPEEPHLYLQCIGVVGTRQGAGIGTALLRHRLDRTDLAVYLEASSPRSRDLYLRHGFVEHGDPVRVPDGPTLWPMLRGAR